MVELAVSLTVVDLIHTNGVLFDILLYAIQLALMASYESKNPFEFLTKHEGNGKN